MHNSVRPEMYVSLTLIGKSLISQMGCNKTRSGCFELQLTHSICLYNKRAMLVASGVCLCCPECQSNSSYLFLYPLSHKRTHARIRIYTRAHMRKSESETGGEEVLGQGMNQGGETVPFRTISHPW